MKTKTLMDIGKLSVIETRYSDEVKDLSFCWTEAQQDSWYGNEDIDIDINKEEAEKLNGILCSHFELNKDKAIVPRTIPQELLNKMRDERVLSPSRVLEMLIEWSENNA